MAGATRVLELWSSTKVFPTASVMFSILQQHRNSHEGCALESWAVVVSWWTVLTCWWMASGRCWTAWSQRWRQWGPGPCRAWPHCCWQRLPASWGRLPALDSSGWTGCSADPESWPLCPERSLKTSEVLVRGVKVCTGGQRQFFVLIYYFKSISNLWKLIDWKSPQSPGGSTAPGASSLTNCTMIQLSLRLTLTVNLTLVLIQAISWIGRSEH